MDHSPHQATGPKEAQYHSSNNGSVSFVSKIFPAPSIDLTLQDDVKCFGSDRLSNSQTESLPHHQTSGQEKTYCNDINGIQVLEYTCKICDKKSGTEEMLRLHKEFRHQQENNSRRCKVCGKKFADFLQFKLHSSIGHKLKCLDYECIARFATEQELRRHMRVEHDPVGPMPE